MSRSSSTTRNEEELVDQVVLGLQALLRGDGKRSDLLRQIAGPVVSLRGQYEFEGHPDWAGRGGEYRDAIMQAYRAARVPQDTVDGLQAALRYHIGNAVREVAPEEELVAAGLDPAGPLGRLQRRREAARQQRQVGRERAAMEAVEHGNAITLPLVPAGDRGRPRLCLASLQDPAALVGLALDAIRATKELEPRGKMAEAIDPMLRRLNDELFDLSAIIRARAARSQKRC